MGAIFKRELKMYFSSMIGYVFIAFFVLVTASYFAINNIFAMSPEFQYVFGFGNGVLDSAEAEIQRFH